MSTHTWHNYGYGICINELTIESVDRVEKLLSLAPIFRDKVHCHFEKLGISNPNVDDYDEYDDEYCLGFTTILYEVIKEAEGIEFLPCEDYYCCRYLIYPPNYPWRIDETDLSLTEDRIKDILNKYVSIITDSPIEIGYESVENGG